MPFLAQLWPLGGFKAAPRGVGDRQSVGRGRGGRTSIILINQGDGRRKQPKVWFVGRDV